MGQDEQSTLSLLCASPPQKYRHFIYFNILLSIGEAFQFPYLPRNREKQQNIPMFRIYVERKPGFQSEAASILGEINGFLGISSVKGVRYFNRYDIENTSEDVSKTAALRIFSEPQSDSLFKIIQNL